MTNSIYNIQFTMYKKRIKEFVDSIKTILGKPIILILVFIIALLSVFAVFFAKQAGVGKDEKFGPLSYPAETSLVGQPINPSVISVALSKKVSLPKTIKVYRVAPVNEEENKNLFDLVSSALGASPSAEIVKQGTEKTYILSAPSIYFVGNLLTGSFSFSGQSAVRFGEDNGASIRLAVWELLNNLGLTNNVNNNPIVSFYDYSGTDLVSAKSSLLADAYSLNYQQTIDGLPIIGLESAANQLWVMVDRKNKNITNFEYNLRKIDPSAGAAYEILSQKEIGSTSLNQIRLVDLLASSGDKLPNYNVGDIASLVINNLSLAYYVSPGLQDYFQPVFVLEGKAVLKDGREAVFRGLLPAVKNLNIGR